MKQSDSDVLDRIRSWPLDDREELLATAASIEARRAGIYRVSSDESLAIGEGLSQLDRGEFVSDTEMAELWAKA